MARPKGWLPDDPTVVSFQIAKQSSAALLGARASAPLPPEVDHTAFLDKIPDQGSTSSCVGQAFATALYLTAALDGKPIPRPSAKLIYDFARAEDQPYIRLHDVGSRPLAAIRCLVEKGMVSEEDWPIQTMPDGSSNINFRPPLDLFQSALGFKVGKYYRIAPGYGASSAIRQALANGYCPVFAMPVDEVYERNEGEIYEGRTGASLGGHMQAFAGYGEGFLRVVSSWGTGHGDQGIVKIADSYVDSGECTDILVATIIPDLTP